MPNYRVTIYLNERLTYYVEADSPEEAEERAGILWTEDAEPENRNSDGPTFAAEKWED